MPVGSLAEYIPLVTNQTGLVNLPTTLLSPNAIIKYIDDITIATVSWQLRTGGLGLLPADYNVTSNNKSWFQV